MGLVCVCVCVTERESDAEKGRKERRKIVR